MEMQTPLQLHATRIRNMIAEETSRYQEAIDLDKEFSVVRRIRDRISSLEREYHQVMKDLEPKVRRV